MKDTLLIIYTERSDSEHFNGQGAPRFARNDKGAYTLNADRWCAHVSIIENNELRG